MISTLRMTSAILLVTTAGFAADIPASSSIEGATLYPQGATLVRSVDFSAPAGSNTVIIDDLPLNFDASTLRVQGEGDAAFTIVSVDHRVSRLPPVPAEESPEYQRIEAELEALQDQMTDLEFDARAVTARLEVANTRMRFIEQLIKREPQKMVDDADAQRAGPETWAASISVLAEQMQIALQEKTAADRDMVGIREQMEELSEDIEEKQAELDATQLPQRPRSIASVEINGDEAVTGTLLVSYRIAEAGWEPVYDLRLTQGEDASLQIDRHARVYQRTGEDWSDVALTLSTTRPSGRMQAPDLPPQLASLFDPQIYARGAVVNQTAPRLEKSVAGLSQTQEAFADLEVEDRAEAEFAPPQVQTIGQTVVFNLGERADVDGDGTVRQMTIDKAEADVATIARSTPEFDTGAYLYANLENVFAGPILPGRASAFRDGAFVGEIFMPMTAPGADATLPFGRIDGIEITRIVLDKEEGDFGIIGTTNRRTEKFEITAQSVLPFAIPLTIYDRMPFSEEEDLEIEFTAQPKPSESDFEGKRGVQAWTLDLKPGGKQTIRFAYELQWPGDKQMILQ